MNVGVVLAASIAGYGLYKVYIYPFFLNPLRKLPGPKSAWWSPMGFLSYIMASEPMEPQLAWMKQYGPIFAFRSLFNEYRCFVLSSTGIRYVLSSHASDFIKPKTTAKFLSDILGQGLVVVEGDIHKRQRAIMNPVFKVKQINALIPTFVQAANELKNVWTDHMNSLPSGTAFIIDTNAEMSKPTLDVIGRAGFGYEFDACSPSSANSENVKLFTAFNTALESLTMSRFLLRHFANFLRWVIPSEIKARVAYEESLKVIRSSCAEILASRRREVELELADPDAVGSKAVDLMTALVKSNLAETQSKNRLTDEEVMSQIMTFLFAGHETTSVALTWTIYYLTRHPLIQQKLRQELVEQMPDSSDAPSEEYITSQHTFLDAIAKESLRLQPPVPITLRTALKDVTIDGHFFPKGTTISLSPYVVHRMKEYWGDDAEEFKPQRWMGKEEGAVAEMGSFIPFIIGPRSCIGSRFAMLELKSMLAVYFRTFEFVETEEGKNVKRKLAITAKPSPALYVEVRRAE
ncbi:cytochrome P450 [Rhizoclosmatium globosum]|uniref:Cytochrome P450 n=1 Tax=Rhizoclosmatium globosum TaxID=329046 RepID=A0A1Y2C8T9_9FUNG|nr:cytochrome P450 [Rhizoclosmatium globosum]|eukprot:ORY43451.1 cytochrome P450 [Rhizoclosmatium globosum]